MAYGSGAVSMAIHKAGVFWSSGKSCLLVQNPLGSEWMLPWGGITKLRGNSCNLCISDGNDGVFMQYGDARSQNYISNNRCNRSSSQLFSGSESDRPSPFGGWVVPAGVVVAIVVGASVVGASVVGASVVGASVAIAGNWSGWQEESHVWELLGNLRLNFISSGFLLAKAWKKKNQNGEPPCIKHFELEFTLQ